MKEAMTAMTYVKSGTTRIPPEKIHAIMKTAKNVRFLAPVIPAEGKTADFTVVPEGDDISVTVSDEAVTYAKMSFTLE